MTAIAQRRVRVWFGEHVICEYDAESERADTYAKVTAQRFAGLRVTVDDSPYEEPGNTLPDPPLWELTVK